MYRKTPLKEVIFRVDFEKISLSKIKDFTEIVKDIFPNQSYNTLNSEIVNITNNNGSHETKVEKVLSHEYNFTNDGNKNTLKITNDYFYIQYFNYSNHEELFSHLELLKQFIHLFEIKVINRLGLRYVNIIENFNETDEFLDEEFCGNFNFYHSEKEKILRNMGKVIKRELDANLEINYGIWNNDFPSSIKKRDFIIDLDCSNIIPISIEEGNDPIDITVSFHTIIISNFEKIITQKYRDFLNS